tara:strand:+ start:116 stop:577 length:462 start_codon:yes stop_codon:yes gene_type:complete
MTTNTTKLAEAIGIISSVLADEVAQTKHFVEVDDDETVSSDEYEELKELITDAFPDFITEVDSIKEDIDLVTDVEDTDDDDDWDDDDDDEQDGDDDNDESEPTDEEKMDMLIIGGAELQEANDQLTETLRTVHASLADLEESLTNLQDEVYGR